VTTRELEFEVLRRTIATRGTARPMLFLATVLGWSAAVIVLLLFADLPVAVVVPLVILAAGFEAVHGLHVGVERIGRYIQTEFETSEPGPRWETTATAFGPALPGGGVDPLFTATFVCCALFNLAIVAILEPTPLEFAVFALLHASFVVRLVRARVAAGRQRAVELERLTSSRSRPVPSAPQA
jgi:hypothetical protein